MANYLYYIGGFDARPGASIAGAYEFSTYDIAGVNTLLPSNNLVIANPAGSYDGANCGEAYGGGGSNPNYNSIENWTQNFNAAGFQGSPQVFVIGCVDNDLVSDLSQIPGQNGAYDRAGITQDQICHHGSLAASVYTVLVPGSVIKFGSQLDGTVLVWYIANGSLGAGANAIGLPMKKNDYPTSGDNDGNAAAKILYYGMGVFKESSGKHAAAYWAPAG